MKSKSIKQTHNLESITPSCAIASLPLLDGEPVADFENFQNACHADLKPKGITESIWVDDFIQYEWEILRLRRMRISILQSSRQDALDRLLNSLIPYDLMGRVAREHLAFNWSINDPDSVEEVNSILEAHGLSSDAVIAEAFKNQMDTLEKLDRLIENCSRRRDAALRNLEKRRDELAARMRNLSSSVSDGAFVEVSKQTKIGE